MPMPMLGTTNALSSTILVLACCLTKYPGETLCSVMTDEPNGHEQIGPEPAQDRSNVELPGNECEQLDPGHRE
jgi:hypothetical protein